MKRDKRHLAVTIDLGAASRRTRGAAGNMTDFVRFIEHWGISND